jgi:hypothetical protein
MSENGVKKIHMLKNIYYTGELFSQFVSTKLKVFCHLVSFSVSTISCWSHVTTLLDLAPRVRKHNFGHCCNLWHVPLLFDNFLRWLTASNSSVMPLHDTIQMEFCLIRKTHTVQESLVVSASFLQHLFPKSLPIVYKEKIVIFELCDIA